jgi:hypothetical protein
MSRAYSFAGPAVVALLALGLSACSGSLRDEQEDVGDDSTSADSALSGTLAIGTKLVTTTTVNFRNGPSTSTAILRTLAKGSLVVTVNRTSPQGKFFNVSIDGAEGWVHGAYLAPTSAPGTVPAAGQPPAPAPGTSPQGCLDRRLRFSADALPALPASSAYVWGGNATGGEKLLDPPYSAPFLARAGAAHARSMEVFAYLEGPCGDTGGVDDGERARCANIHNAYNALFAPGTPNTAKARWKPYTMKQLTTSGQLGVDYCEIDNLENQVTIPLNPLLQEIKGLFDAGKIHCRLVLKNVSTSGIDSIRSNVAATPADANFIAPFHIYEADDTSEKAGLDAAMKRLKGPGAVTIVSTDTNHYGSAFTPDTFRTCK